MAVVYKCRLHFCVFALFAQLWISFLNHFSHEKRLFVQQRNDLCHKKVAKVVKLYRSSEDLGMLMLVGNYASGMTLMFQKYLKACSEKETCGFGKLRHEGVKAHCNFPQNLFYTLQNLSLKWHFCSLLATLTSQKVCVKGPGSLREKMRNFHHNDPYKFSIDPLLWTWHHRILIFRSVQPPLLVFEWTGSNDIG